MFTGEEIPAIYTYGSVEVNVSVFKYSNPRCLPLTKEFKYETTT